MVIRDIFKFEKIVKRCEFALKKCTYNSVKVFFTCEKT